MLFATATLLVSFFALVDAAPQPVARASGQYIHPGRDTSKCLAVVSAGGRNPNIVNNAPVVAVDCSSTSLGVSKLWTISRGNNLVQLGDTGYCLDAGSNPSNNVQAKIYQCYPGLSQQQWYYTDDNRIAITGGTQCLDYRSDGVVQTYTCSTGNTNQVWLTNNGNGGSPPVSSSVVPPPPSSSVAPPGPSQSTVPPPTGGKRIQAASDKSICLTVESKNVGDGTRVGFTPCSSALDSQQLWTYTAGSRGLIKLASANYCLDAGSNPANNIGAKVWTCYDGLSNQEWTIATGTISIQSANQCLDRQQGSTDVVQTYQCFNGNSNQMWIYQ